MTIKKKIRPQNLTCLSPPPTHKGVRKKVSATLNQKTENIFLEKHGHNKRFSQNNFLVRKQVSAPLNKNWDHFSFLGAKNYFCLISVKIQGTFLKKQVSASKIKRCRTAKCGTECVIKLPFLSNRKVILNTKT